MTCRYDDDWDFMGWMIPKKVHIVLPDSNINKLPRLGTLTADENKTFDYLYFELEDKNAVFTGDKLGDMLCNLKNVYNLYLPESMHTIRANEFDSSDLSAEKSRKIHSVVVPANIVNIEDHAFETKDHIIGEVLIPYENTTENDRKRISAMIEKSSKNLSQSGMIITGDGTFICYHDPDYIV